MKEKARSSITRQIDSLRFYLSPRYLLGIALILASFISAYTISANSNRTIQVWAAKTDLAPGMVLSLDNIEQVRALLPFSASRYLGESAKIIGTTVVRPVGKDELIPSFALAAEGDTYLRRVPIPVSKGFFPSDLAIGNVIDLYVVPNKNTYSSNTTPNDLFTLYGLAVEAVDSSNLSIGGGISVTLLVPEASVRPLIESLSGSQLILVKR